MQNWRKLFVVGTYVEASSSHQRILWANHVVFAQKDSIKLERICEHESSSKGFTAAALEKQTHLLSFYKYRASEASEKIQQRFVSFFSKKNRVDR